MYVEVMVYSEEVEVDFGGVVVGDVMLEDVDNFGGEVVFRVVVV